MNILEKIVAQKRKEISQLPSGHSSLRAIQEALKSRGRTRSFQQALLHPRRGDIALIAEVKKASPSAGVICPDFDPVAIAVAYEKAGASCLSVLTDEQFFQGSLTYLKAIREASSLPLLRKDFIIDERQIVEAAQWGADAILLIVAILDDPTLRHLYSLAKDAGLSVLVEVHDAEELDRAVSAGAELIGVNNRNLKNFQVDLATTEHLAARLQLHGSLSDKLLVAESGIHTRENVVRVQTAGARALLVGESLMRSGIQDLDSKIAELLGSSKPPATNG